MEVTRKLIELERELEKSSLKLIELESLRKEDKIIIQTANNKIKELQMILNQKNKNEHFHDNIVRGIRNYTKELKGHKSSQFQKRIIQLSQGSEKEFYLELFGIHKSTYYNYLKNETLLIKPIKYRQEERMKIVNDLLPVSSGREYRIQRLTNNQLYEQYRKLASQPYSFDAFVKYLRTLTIYHSNYYPCPLCETKDCQTHTSQYTHQRKSFLLQKESLQPCDKLIILDFSKIDEYNDLIISIVEPSGIRWHHRIGTTKDENNDTNFVITVFNSFITTYLSENKKIENVIIWSDGGKKHFKNSKMQQFILQYQAKTDIRFQWNFFISYHGYNPCDLASAHLKRNLITAQNSKCKKLNIEDIVSLANSMVSHGADVITTNSSSEQSITTLHGISKYHQFTYLTSKIVGKLLFPTDHDPKNLAFEKTKKSGKIVTQCLPFTNFWLI